MIPELIIGALLSLSLLALLYQPRLTPAQRGGPCCEGCGTAQSASAAPICPNCRSWADRQVEGLW